MENGGGKEEENKGEGYGGMLLGKKRG